MLIRPWTPFSTFCAFGRSGRYPPSFVKTPSGESVSGSRERVRRGTWTKVAVGVAYGVY
jgi:hypothetical protein